MPDQVLLERKGNVAVITINRPERLNAFDAPTIKLLADSLTDVACDPGSRAVVLAGAGRAFCAGGDLRAVPGRCPDRPGDAFYELAAFFHRCVSEIRVMEKPVVAALSGPAAGGGFSLALACDLRVMSEDAYLKQAYTSNGLAIDGGGTFTLPRIVGLARALEIALLDEPIDARAALEMGLVTRVVPAGRVMGEALALAQGLALGALGTLGTVKRLLNRSFDTSLETQLELERLALRSTANSAEGREGLIAFATGRKPSFTSS
jgi:2-(1,2-epoxy-1,2-dihydrophenyl)acetyl-CoA isomerase